jgi:hypothetical protein
MPRSGKRRRRRTRKERLQESGSKDEPDPHEVTPGGFAIRQDSAADPTAWLLRRVAIPQEIWVFYKMGQSGGYQPPSSSVTPTSLEFTYLGSCSVADPSPFPPNQSGMLNWIMSETGDSDPDNYTIELLTIS